MLRHYLTNLFLSPLAAKLLQGKLDVSCADLAVYIGVKSFEHGIQALISSLTVQNIFGGIDTGQELRVTDQLVAVVVDLVDNCLDLSLLLLAEIVLFEGR